MSAAAPVRCKVCKGVVFGLVFGQGEGVCCGWRYEAVRETVTSDVRITKVDRPQKRLTKVLAYSAR